MALGFRWIILQRGVLERLVDATSGGGRVPIDRSALVLGEITIAPVDEVRIPRSAVGLTLLEEIEEKNAAEEAYER